MPQEVQSGPLGGTAADEEHRPVEELYPHEVHRWTLLLGIPMLAACLCIALAFGTHFHWFYAGAIAFGPGLGVLAIMYLAISSDTNGITFAHGSTEELPEREPVATAAAA